MKYRTGDLDDYCTRQDRYMIKSDYKSYNTSIMNDGSYFIISFL